MISIYKAKEVIRSAFYLLGKTSIARRISKSRSNDPAILTFHRVLPESEAHRDLTGNSIGIESFETIVRKLSREYHVISMSEFANALDSGFVPPRSICITFDDGYHDVLDYALPILQRYEAPATLYVATSFPEMAAQLWWYSLLEAVFNQTRSVICAADGTFRMNMKNDLDRRLTYRKLWRLFSDKMESEQESLLQELGIACVKAKDYVLSWSDLHILNKSGLFEIGCHSHHHWNFATHDVDLIKEDIIKSKKLIKEKLDIYSDHFAYPFGKKKHYKKISSLVANCGFRTAVTTEIFSFSKDMNPLELPRHVIGPENAAIDRVMTRLSGWNLLLGLQI